MWYVYVDWTTEPSPRPFYVGKGTVARVQRVLRSKHHSAVMRKYGLERKVLVSFLAERDALDHEIELIAEHHTYVYDSRYNGIGCNHTVGGDGISGFKHSVEAVESNRVAHVGLMQSQETCDKKRQSMKSSSRVRRRSVLQLDDNENVIASYTSVCAAAEAIGRPSAVSLISRCCRGRSRHAYGSTWRYEDSAPSESFDRMGNSGSNDAKLIEQVDMKTGEVINTFASVSAAARSVERSTVSIRMCCQGKRSTAYGFAWRYIV